jgi:hypothetical protein
MLLNMNQQIVLKLLNRFRVTDLKVVIDNWSALKSRNIKKSCFHFLKESKGTTGKKKFVNTVLKLTQVS